MNCKRVRPRVRRSAVIGETKSRAMRPVKHGSSPALTLFIYRSRKPNCFTEEMISSKESAKKSFHASFLEPLQ